MANSNNARSSVYPQPNDRLHDRQVVQRRLIIDTVDTDLIVHAPVASASNPTGNTTDRIYLKGILISNAAATNLTIKNRSRALQGTVATTSGSAVITGTGTAFLTDYALTYPDDQIVIDANGTPQALTILSVDSDTQITATATAGSTVSGKTHAQQSRMIILYLTDYEGLSEKVQEGAYMLATPKGFGIVVSASVAIPELIMHTQQGAG